MYFNMVKFGTILNLLGTRQIFTLVEQYMQMLYLFRVLFSKKKKLDFMAVYFVLVAKL